MNQDQARGETKAILGIDISKADIHVTLLWGGTATRQGFANDRQGFQALERWLQQQGVEQVHACLEATGRYGAGLALHLHGAGHIVSIVNPFRIHKYGESQLRRHKHDVADADLIADYCRTQDPRPWQPRAPLLEQLQALARRLEGLKAMRTQERNRQHEAPAALEASLARHLAFLDEEIVEVEAALDASIADQPELQQQQALLLSIPGIGLPTARHLLAELPDLTHFTSADQLVAFAGLCPHPKQSGSSLRRSGSLTQHGQRRLRKLLYFPALTATRFNPPVQALADRLRRRHKHPFVILGAAMRKLLRIVYGVLKSQMPFDPDFARSQHIPT